MTTKIFTNNEYEIASENYFNEFGSLPVFDEYFTVEELISEYLEA